MSDVVHILRDELADLERQIAELFVLQRRAGKIRDLLKEYEPKEVSTRRPPMQRRAPYPSRDGVGAQPGSMAQRIVDGAAEYLRRKGSRAGTSEIVRALAEAGVLPAGTTRDEYGVSSRLSRSSLFDGGRGQGYGLAEWYVHEEAERFPARGNRGCGGPGLTLTPRKV